MSFNGPMSDISDISHGLLEPPSPAYTNVTVRRAFIVWMYCGQRNKFKDVCNYFHYLEALEDELTPERRALSRHHEFNLFSNQPPTSAFLVDHFPQLYKETFAGKHYMSKVEEIRNDKGVFKLEGFNDIAPKQGTASHDIVEASRMIRKYCRIQMVSLKKFLEEFKQHAKKCDLNYTVNNAALYIKRKMVEAEIELEANYRKTLGFLNSTSAENLFNNIQDSTLKYESKDCKSVSGCKKTKEDSNFRPIKILRKGNGDPDETIKRYCGNTINIENCYFDGKIMTLKADSVVLPNLEITATKATTNIKSASIEDLTEEKAPLRKERRFSGSQFMKIESDKIRKI